jgi:Na+/proline symporter
VQLATVDWIVIAVSLAAAFAPAVFFARRASTGTTEFFASGRSAPWWLIGTSMVATTFSTDTPNLVTDFVRTNGVSQNWAWWAFLITGMMTVFFYARMWRRSGVLTDLEFYELRYSGRSAAFVRGFRAVYLGLFFNCAIMATVTLAAAKIANVMLGWSRLQTVILCGLLCIVFAAMSGLWGVLASDMIQFAVAMVGVFAAAYVALSQPEVGGLAGLVAKVDPATLRLLPDFSDWGLTLSVLVVPLTIQWWSVWYPGAEPGGGSYIAQRMLAAKDERHAMAATLWFNIAHYALRPWPWIIVALCSLLVFPTLGDLQAALPHVSSDLIGHDMAYPAMLTLLPAGLLGLLLASLLSAYVSTMSTHLNWGCSYLVHDLYRRFLNPTASERHLVWLSRAMTALLMAISGLRDRSDLPLALVLVADQRLERDRGHGLVLHHRGGALPGAPRGARDVGTRRLGAVGGRDHGGVGVGHLPHAAHGPRDPAPLLPSGPAGRPRLAAGRGGGGSRCRAEKQPRAGVRRLGAGLHLRVLGAVRGRGPALRAEGPGGSVPRGGGGIGRRAGPGGAAGVAGRCVRAGHVTGLGARLKILFLHRCHRWGMDRSLTEMPGMTELPVDARRRPPSG